MSELNKTTCYLVVALGAIGLALFTRPSIEEFDVEQRLGQLLVEDIPTDAPKVLRITSRNEATGEVDAFEVAQKRGVWTIPSKSGYPADATEQLAAAVEGVNGLEILDVVDATAAQHVIFGVVDPEDPEADTGYGKHIELVDAEEKPLVDLIIGEKVADTDNRYWVRKTGQDVVYDVAIDPAKFSTNFADWIEKDLLGLSTFNVAQVFIDDYSSDMYLVPTQRGARPELEKEQRSQMRLLYNEDEDTWQIGAFETYNKDKEAYEPLRLADNQQLNQDILRELKNALDDLQIVDVDRKPEGLSADLQAGNDFMNNNATINNLLLRGFLPWPKDRTDPNSPLELNPSEGEIVVTLNNGAEYVLRFGRLQSEITDEPSAGDTADEADPAEDPATQAGLNRFLFVMARFNESAIEQPAFEELPELPPADESTEADSDTPAEDAESTDEATDPAAAEGEDAAEPAQPTREQIQTERDRIELNNKRLQDDYNDKVAAGKKRVEELNARFGDWYYVIPNDVFKKIHLNSDQMIEVAPPEAAAQGQAPAQGGFGLPGLSIPGLPGTQGLMGGPSAPAEPAATEQPAADESAEPAAEQAPAEEPAPEETPAADATDEAIPELPSVEEPAPAEPVTEEPADVPATTEPSPEPAADAPNGQ